MLAILVLPFWFFLTAFFQAQKQVRIIHTYVPVQAIVVSSKVRSFTGSKGQVYYVPDVQYEYEVSGRKYQSDRYLPLPLSDNRSWAQSVVDEYPSRKAIQAYCDPNDPAQAILVRQYSANPYDFMLAFAFVVVTTLCILLHLWFRRRQCAVAVENGQFEIVPQFGQRQRLLVAITCAFAWYILGAVPMIHYSLCVPASANLGEEARFKVYAIIGLVPVAFVVWYWFQNWSLEEALLRLGAAEVILGKACVYKISQRARRSIQARRIRLRIIGTGTRGKGKARSRRTIYQATLSELTNHTLRAGENLEMSGTLTLPANQRPSGRDSTGEFTRVDWKMELDYETGVPNYRGIFPIEILPAVPEPAEIEKPRELAQIQATAPDSARRISQKETLGKLISVLPVLAVLAGCGLVMPFILHAVPNRSGDPLFPNVSRTEAEWMFALGAILLVPTAVIGTLFPSLLGGSYIYSAVKAEFKRRNDAIVEPGADSVFVGVVPRSHWNRLNIETDDIGFLAVDAQRREIRFEGGKERYRVPAGAVQSCELEKSLYTNSAPPTAPGIWLVVLRIQTAAGNLEKPIAPYLIKARMSTKLRLKAAQELQAKIQCILTKP